MQWSSNMSRYVIGIDTGSTKSHLALFDTDGTLVYFDHWGALSPEGISGSFAQFEDELGQFVGRVLSRTKITMKQVAYSVLGLTGADTKLQHDILSGIARKIGFEQFTLVNDAFLGIPAGNPLGVGICAINGTGCTLAGINKEGKMLQIGGVGYISADYGGGGIMGRLVVSTVYNELFRKGEPTSMTPVLFQKLGISSKYDFVDKMYEKVADKSLSITGCSRMLFEAVRENDNVAAKLLRDMGVSYAGGIACMIDELKFHPEEDLYVIFAGSNFVKGEHPLLLDTIKEIVNRDHPAYRIKYILLKIPPVAGGVIWALKMLNENRAAGCYDKVCAQFLRQGRSA
jgi:N-acetylglucosamine kinase-like BadF-type ATPase